MVVWSSSSSSSSSSELSIRTLLELATTSWSFESRCPRPASLLKDVRRLVFRLLEPDLAIWNPIWSSKTSITKVKRLLCLLQCYKMGEQTNDPTYIGFSCIADQYQRKVKKTLLLRRLNKSLLSITSKKCKLDCWQDAFCAICLPAAMA